MTDTRSQSCTRPRFDSRPLFPRPPSSALADIIAVLNKITVRLPLFPRPHFVYILTIHFKIYLHWFVICVYMPYLILLINQSLPMPEIRSDLNPIDVAHIRLFLRPGHSQPTKLSYVQRIHRLACLAQINEYRSLNYIFCSAASLQALPLFERMVCMASI